MTDQPAYDIEASHVFDASRQRVFRAFVDAGAFSRWYGPPGFPVPLETVEIEPQPGGRHRFAMVAAAGGRRHGAGPGRIDLRRHGAAG